MTSASGQFENILAGAKRGDDSAITTLYRELHPSLLRYLRAQAPRDGEDIASQVWVDVAPALVRFIGDEAAFRRWFFTIAHRRLTDYRRHEGRGRIAWRPIRRRSSSSAFWLGSTSKTSRQSWERRLEPCASCNTALSGACASSWRPSWHEV